MIQRTIRKNILLSFVGSNDAGGMFGSDNDGAILTVFRERRFQEVHLLYNEGKAREIPYQLVAEHIKDELLSRKLCKNVFIHKIDIKFVTDHNEIYPLLLRFCRLLPVDENIHYSAAIASGTPAMQVCWILMAESGDFPIDLIRSNEPKFGKPYVTPVKLGLGLPKIIRLEEENRNLRNQNDALIPIVKLNVKRGSLTIGDKLINLSPIEFSYYRFFAESVRNKIDDLRVTVLGVPKHFLEKIISFHEESFPDSDMDRQILIKLLRDRIPLASSTFRGNVSKANKKIRTILNNPSLSSIFEIAVEGNRGAKHYSLKVSVKKIIIR